MENHPEFRYEVAKHYLFVLYLLPDIVVTYTQNELALYVLYLASKYVYKLVNGVVDDGFTEQHSLNELISVDISHILPLDNMGEKSVSYNSLRGRDPDFPNFSLMDMYETAGFKV
jgi:hypothetical protein